MTERRYSDEEVALILREASEAGDGGAAGRAHGLSLTQLKEIAAEVGLDPSQVEVAANRLVHHRAGGKIPFLGTPVTPEFEREIPGELSADDMAELVTTIRKVLGRRGVTGTEMGTFEWKAGDPMGGRYVSVRPKDGSTRLRVFANFRDGLGVGVMAGGLLMTTAFAVLLTALGAKELVGPGVLPIGALLSVLPIRQIWRWRYRKEEDALADLTEALDSQIRALVERKELECTAKEDLLIRIPTAARLALPGDPTRT